MVPACDWFVLHATVEFGRQVAQALGRPIAMHEVREFEDGEHKARSVDIAS